MPLQVDLVSPERILWSGGAEMVVCRTVGEGEVAFLAGHAPFLAALDIGEVRIQPTGAASKLSAAVHRGFVEVRDDQVSILSDAAELGHEIDVSRAEQARHEAERTQPEPADTSEEAAEVREALRRAILRIDVGRKVAS